MAAGIVVMKEYRKARTDYRKAKGILDEVMEWLGALLAPRRQGDELPPLPSDDDLSLKDLKIQRNTHYRRAICECIEYMHGSWCKHIGRVIGSDVWSGLPKLPEESEKYPLVFTPNSATDLGLPYEIVVQDVTDVRYWVVGRVVNQGQTDIPMGTIEVNVYDQQRSLVSVVEKDVFDLELYGTWAFRIPVYTNAVFVDVKKLTAYC